LKQAPRCWFSKLSSALKQYGFTQSLSDYSLFSYNNDGIFVHVLVYVDDLIISGSCPDAVAQFKSYLESCFHMKDLGLLKYFLGIEVSRNAQGFYLSQRKYVLDIISEMGLLGARPSAFPLEQNHKLSLSTSPLLSDSSRYRRLVGRLIYLAVTRPELSYSVHTLAQFMQNPRQDHWNSAIRVVRYLKSNPGQGIYSLAPLLCRLMVGVIVTMLLALSLVALSQDTLYSLVILPYLGKRKSSPLSVALPRRLNIELWHSLLKNSCGSSGCFMILVSLTFRLCASSLTVNLQLLSVSIQFSMSAPNMLRWIVILSAMLFLMV